MEMVSEKKMGDKDGCSSPGLETELMEQEKLPLEIILYEIMYRLPVKHLARLRSVCKIFNSVISSNPNFAILQLKNSLATRTCFDRQRVLLWDLQDCSAAFFLERKSSAGFSIKRINTCPMEGNESYEVVASCDGLVCIVNTMTNSIIFWNPLTGETKIVSDPPEGISLSYHWCSHGLGYDSSTDDYKLVWIKNDPPEIQKPQWNGVYSLKTNSWQQIPEFPTKIMCLHKTGVFINGAFYWIANKITDDYYKVVYVVVSFCLKREKYSVLSNVPVYDSEPQCFHSGIEVMGNRLAAYFKSIAGNWWFGSTWFNFLFLDRDEYWTEHTVTPPEGRAFYTPLCLLEDVDEVLFRGREGELVVCRLSDDTFRYSRILGLPERFEVTTFSESLISPNTYSGSMIRKITGMKKKELEIADKASAPPLWERNHNFESW